MAASSYQIFLALIIGFVELSSAGMNGTGENSTNDLFHLVLPEGGFQAIRKRDPLLQSAILYAAPELNFNFTISISSSRHDVSKVLKDLISVSQCSPDPLQSENTTAVVGVNEFRGRLNGNTSAVTEGPTTANLPIHNASCYNITFKTTADWLGYSTLTFVLHISNGTIAESFELGKALVTVKRPIRILDKVFVIVIQILVACAMFGMGTDLSLETVKKHLKKPKAPLIALFSQFTFMPLLAFSVIYILGLKGGAALGMFMLGASPGGGNSNMYAKLLNGDVSVSITMTMLSTLASLGMIPFWVYTLGSVVPTSEEVGRIPIPFVNILSTLALIIVPLLFGILVQKKLPRVAKYVRKGLKVFFIIFMLYILTVGVYSNLYIYESFNPTLVFGSAVLPVGGYFCGGLLAFALRLDWKLIKTVSLETGIQNVGVAILVTKMALKPPDSDLAIIAPVAAAFMTGLPLITITLIYVLWEKFCKRKESEDKPEEIEQEEQKLNEEPHDLDPEEGKSLSRKPLPNEDSNDNSSEKFVVDTE